MMKDSSCVFPILSEHLCICMYLYLFSTTRMFVILVLVHLDVFFFHF
jgi:hypothetical protein